jgi:hypothetical protein
MDFSNGFSVLPRMGERLIRTCFSLVVPRT